MADARKTVALFGGSFNPPHLGHSAICRWLFDEMKVDGVWVIPCYIHPFEKKLAPFEHRVVMCRLAFSKTLLPIRVLDVEEKLGGESRTLRTIQHLQQEFPKLRFALVVGEDVEAEAEKWHNFDLIRKAVDLIRVPRGPTSPIPNVSSTDVRDLLRDKKAYHHLVEKEVAVYIATKALYRDR
jgi:nicotinate-nucleotide adenylyltransferase